MFCILCYQELLFDTALLPWKLVSCWLSKEKVSLNGSKSELFWFVIKFFPLLSVDIVSPLKRPSKSLDVSAEFVGLSLLLFARPKKSSSTLVLLTEVDGFESKNALNISSFEPLVDFDWCCTSVASSAKKLVSLNASKISFWNAKHQQRDTRTNESAYWSKVI